MNEGTSVWQQNSAALYAVNFVSPKSQSNGDWTTYLPCEINIYWKIDEWALVEVFLFMVSDNSK